MAVYRVENGKIEPVGRDTDPDWRVKITILEDEANSNEVLRYGIDWIVVAAGSINEALDLSRWWDAHPNLDWSPDWLYFPDAVATP